MFRKIYYNQFEGDGSQNQGPDAAALSAFSQPEGYSEAMMEGDKLGESKVVMPNPVVTDTPPITPTDGIPPVIPPVTPPITTPTEVKYNPIWDEYATKYGNEANPFEIPAEVKEGKLPEGTTELDYFLNKAISHSNPVSKALDSLPPTVKDYLANASKEGFDENKWLEAKVQERNFLNQSDEDFMFNHFKNVNGLKDDKPNGWTDEQIQEKVQAMKNAGILDIQAMGLKDAYKAQEVEQATLQMQKAQEAQRQEFERVNNDQLKVAQEVITKHQNTKDYFGIQFGEAEKKQFDADFIEMVKLNPETGQHKLHEMLLSDDNLYKVAALLWKGDKGIRDYLSTVKEGIKQDVLNKTGVNPKEQSSSTNTGPSAPDMSAWLAPERTIESY